LKRNLDEARSEWVLDPPDAPRSRRNHRQQGLSELYGEAVDSLNRLAQHLAGLRSGTKLQRDLTKVYGKKHATRKQNGSTMNTGAGKIGTIPEANKYRKDLDEEGAALAASAAVFGDLVEDVGPPMVALTVSTYIKSILMLKLSLLRMPVLVR
jgi:hypothetical protein